MSTRWYRPEENEEEKEKIMLSISELFRQSAGTKFKYTVLCAVSLETPNATLSTVRERAQNLWGEKFVLVSSTNGALKRLERNGLIESQILNNERGNRQKFYFPTDKGKKITNKFTQEESGHLVSGISAAEI